MKRYEVLVSEPWDFKDSDGRNVISGEVIEWYNDRCIVFRTDEPVRFADDLSGNILILSKRFEKQPHLNGLTVNGGLLRVKYDANSLTNYEQELVQGIHEIVIGGTTTAAGGAGTIVTAPACGTGVGCALPAATGAVTATGAVVTAHGAAVITNTIYNMVTDKTNAFDGPITKDVTVVDGSGNAIPVKAGEQVTGSPDGNFIQVRDSNGAPNGIRKDGPHKPATHPDPRAQKPHGHRPGVTNPDGTVWLPIN